MQYQFFDFWVPWSDRGDLRHFQSIDIPSILFTTVPDRRVFWEYQTRRDSPLMVERSSIRETGELIHGFIRSVANEGLPSQSTPTYLVLNLFNGDGFVPDSVIYSVFFLTLIGFIVSIYFRGTQKKQGAFQESEGMASVWFVPILTFGGCGLYFLLVFFFCWIRETSLPFINNVNLFFVLVGMMFLPLPWILFRVVLPQSRFRAQSNLFLASSVFLVLGEFICFWKGYPELTFVFSSILLLWQITALIGRSILAIPFWALFYGVVLNQASLNIVFEEMLFSSMPPVGGFYPLAYSVILLPLMYYLFSIYYDLPDRTRNGLQTLCSKNVFFGSVVISFLLALLIVELPVNPHPKFERIHFVLEAEQNEKTIYQRELSPGRVISLGSLIKNPFFPAWNSNHRVPAKFNTDPLFKLQFLDCQTIKEKVSEKSSGTDPNTKPQITGWVECSFMVQNLHSFPMEIVSFKYVSDQLMSIFPAISNSVWEKTGSTSLASNVIDKLSFIQANAISIQPEEGFQSVYFLSKEAGGVLKDTLVLKPQKKSTVRVQVTVGYPSIAEDQSTNLFQREVQYSTLAKERITFQF